MMGASRSSALSARIATALVLITAGGPAIGGAAEPRLRLVYPALESPGDPRSSYPLAVLQLALAHGGGDFDLQPAAAGLPPERAVEELAAGTGKLDILWTMSTRMLEDALLPVRIPIDRGLFGWRVALVRADRAALFGDVHTVTDLRRFTAGQNRAWPDVAVLRAAGLPVVTADGYGNLFAMLAAGRFDYFPRSVSEVTAEAGRNAAHGLVIEPRLLLHYPAAAYFFLNRQRSAVADRIRRGLEAAIRDGSFERLFERYHRRELEGLRLERRQLIELDNPELPDSAPLDRSELWFRLSPAGARPD